MKTIQVIIETPKGSNLKYHYDERTRLFHLKKMLPAGMIFPYDFGFLPGTKGEDSDPLDVLVISEFPAFPGCVIECRLIGGFQAEQSDSDSPGKTIRNDRFFAVPELSRVYEQIADLNDLPEKLIKEIEQFFIQYNKLEKKKFRVLKKLQAKAAIKLIQQHPGR